MTQSQIPKDTSSFPRQICLGVWVLGFGILLVAGSGCAKARAATTVPDGPPLLMPQPPERVLGPVDEPAIAAPEPEPAPAPAAPPPRPVARPAEPRPQPPAQPQPVQPPPAATVDGRDLRAPPATAPTERSVRDLLARAARDVARVNYQQLSADGRAQYDQSKRFAAQAEAALKERNLIFAATLADKAATLAAELLR